MKLFRAEMLHYNGGFYRDYGVLVEGDTIKAVKPVAELEAQYKEQINEIICWKDQVMVAGTVNVHNHSFQSLLRGIGADRPFLEWRDESLYKFSNKMTLEDIYNGAVFAFSEMMKRGVTTVCDFFYLHNFGMESDEAVIQAAKDVGIRLVLARTMYDWKGAPKGYVETIEEAVTSTRELFYRYKEDDMVNIVPAPHSLHAATTEMIMAGHRLAEELGTKFHIHVAEEPFEVEECRLAHNGMTVIEYLNSIGVVDEHMMIVHGVYLREEEIKLLGKKGVSLAYCPSSNMFLADGITNIPAMMEAGVTIGLGSDGACSNNRISVFEEMRMVSILQKASTCNAMCVNYNQSFAMGTVNGGKILDLPVGEIKEGMKADFVSIDLSDFSMQPLNEQFEQMLPNIVYSMEPTALKHVVVNGEVTVSHGKLRKLTEDSVIKGVKDTMSRFYK
ncbi:amidohydrolase [Clostridium sp. HBUAS56010]|uniref:amidohydrolase family protein n=1 Tax=Clostridium sp. HBUAS56010 TaxID=2571127 RepID=UPI001178840D|nr:amidohydrolase [Clostridium sp. HBUAS56010]